MFATRCESCEFASRRIQGISEDWLRQKYIVEELTDQEIAEVIGCSTRTINTYRKQFGIPTIERKEETGRRISEARIGKKLSASHRQSIREARLGKRLTMEHRKNVSRSLMGRPVSEDTRHKISKAVKVAYARGDFADRAPRPPFVLYQGIPMRSTWESRLAAAFDALNWEWEYEAHKFQYELEDGSHTYTPDFYVHDTDCYYDPHPSFWDSQDPNQGKFPAVRAQHNINLIVLDEQLLKSYELAAGIGVA